MRSHDSLPDPAHAAVPNSAQEPSRPLSPGVLPTPSWTPLTLCGSPRESIASVETTSQMVFDEYREMESCERPEMSLDGRQNIELWRQNEHLATRLRGLEQVAALQSQAMEGMVATIKELRKTIQLLADRPVIPETQVGSNQVIDERTRWLPHSHYAENQQFSSYLPPPHQDRASQWSPSLEYHDARLNSHRPIGEEQAQNLEAIASLALERLSSMSTTDTTMGPSTSQTASTTGFEVPSTSQSSSFERMGTDQPWQSVRRKRRSMKRKNK